MVNFPALLCTALIGALCSTSSAQFGVEDPRFEDDPRELSGDPRDEQDPREADVLAREAEQIETLTVHQLFDELYEKDDRRALATALGESSWELLGYLDKMCERWHTLVEAGALEGGTRQLEADTLRQRCVDLARLADQVTGDTTFFLYTERQFRWDAEERLSFREGQAEYARALRLVGQALHPDELTQALMPLQRARESARTLGDTWGQTLALTLAAQIHRANGDLETAASLMQEGLRLGRQIRDLDTVWSALSLSYSAAIEGALWEQAQDILAAQYELAVELADEQTSAQILERLIELNDYVSQVGN